MQQIHNLQPPGRFLIEDETGDHCISSNNGSSQSDIAVHPLLLKKAWVQVENDKTIDKIMHRLREKEHQPKLRMNDVQTKPIPGGSMKVKGCTNTESP